MNILVTSHSTLCTGLISAYEMLASPDAHRFSAVSLTDGGIGDFRARLGWKFAELSSQGNVLTLADLTRLGADYGGVLNIGNYSVGREGAGNIALATMLSIPNAGEWLPLQTTLDGISSRVLPLIAVLTTWWMINKKQFSPTKAIIVFSVVVAIACLLGVF